jgi:hypothetical protein
MELYLLTHRQLTDPIEGLDDNARLLMLPDGSVFVLERPYAAKRVPRWHLARLRNDSVVYRRVDEKDVFREEGQAFARLDERLVKAFGSDIVGRIHDTLQRTRRITFAELCRQAHLPSHMRLTMGRLLLKDGLVIRYEKNPSLVSLNPIYDVYSTTRAQEWRWKETQKALSAISNRPPGPQEA